MSVRLLSPDRILSAVKWKCLLFNGSSYYVHVPDSDLINTDGPYPNRTIEVLFKCYDVSRTTHQVIWEEGGGVRGFNIYILNGRLYAGAWNEIETGWNGNWISMPVVSNTIYHVFLILRNGTDTIEPDKLELWVNGNLIGKEQGTQVYVHSSDIGVGAVVDDTKFHDVGGAIVDLGYYFYGEVYLVRVYNRALSDSEIKYNLNHLWNPLLKGLVLWYDITSVTDTVWYDKSGYGNDGTIYGATAKETNKIIVR